MTPAVVNDMFINLIGDSNCVKLLAQAGDGAQFATGEYATSGIVWGINQNRPCFVAEGSPQPIGI